MSPLSVLVCVGSDEGTVLVWLSPGQDLLERVAKLARMTRAAYVSVSVTDVEGGLFWECDLRAEERAAE